ncbi:MAG TPA: Gfo/Idh/MocA family oxidoreductase [Verrucomicrobiae bacterium]|nr:Gfo/Idh/MocA family oxidoreductase [Verrucomicrobiae bacterium]
MALAATIAPFTRAAESLPKQRYRAVIIGHTGHGNYGHDMDLIFTDHPKIEVVAVADPDEAGRAKAAQRAKAPRQYAEYKIMLQREKPDLVCVGPRWTDQHYAMIRAALESGAHVFSEKPFTQTLAEADELLALAEKLKRKIAVAHQMRLAPGILHLKSALDNGVIGDLVEIKAYGKQDSRAGGEDMLVLGVHLFDLTRFFGGDAEWCHARVQTKGRDITRADAHNGTEAIGLIAGDDVRAQFGFAHGVTGTFTSTQKLRALVGHWGIELVGSKGKVRILADVFPRILIMKPTAWTDRGRLDEWKPIDGDPTTGASADERSFAGANRRVVDDWLQAIEQQKEPTCSGRSGMKAIEFVMAVYESALTRSRVALPLARRSDPLAGA